MPAKSARDHVRPCTASNCPQVMIRDSGWELNSHYHHLHKLNLELNSLDAETACLIMSQCGVATPSVFDMANV